jgi:hypothetical protein
MPIATPQTYAEMLKRAKEGGYAFPAINCTSSETINAAIKGFADAKSDGIIQFSTGGAEFGSGLGVKDMVTGAVALAEFAHVIAEHYDVTVALHTDHCPKDKLDTYVRPLIAISKARVDAGGNRRPPTSSSRSRSVSSVVKRTAWRPRSTTSSTRRSRTSRRPSRRWAPERRAATCSRRPSATCTASTSRAT